MAGRVVSDWKFSDGARGFSSRDLKLLTHIANIRATGAKILATGNPGCQMQIGAGALLAGMDLTVCHPVELLDESYARAGIYNQGIV